MIDGVFPALPTFFDTHNVLDEGAYSDHLHRLADAGVDGFVCVATTGESPTVEEAERNRLLELALAVARRRDLKVIAGCGSASTKKTIEWMNAAHAMGCSAGLVVTPYYNKPTQAGLLAHYREIATRSALPIVLYNVPGRTSTSLQPDTVLKLFELPGIVGIKEASGSPAQWMEIATRANLAEKALLAGDDDAFAHLLALGGRGIISTTANVLPERFVALYRAHQKGESSEAFAIQKEMYPVIRAMFSETNPGPLKWALHRAFGTPDVLRLPLVPVSTPTKEAIDRLLAERGLLRV